MDRLKKLFQGEQAYEPITEDSTGADGHGSPSRKQRPFSYIEYTIFLLLGISMLWAWNMFLAAGPYFLQRFRDNDWMSDNFQAAEISVSTVTNLGTVLLLTYLHANASYPKRIASSLLINLVTFSLLALFTKAFVDIGSRGYFAFLMIMMFLASLAAGLCQNGIFAYVSGFGQPVYTKGIMTGQAIAGVLPCIAQIATVLSVSEHRPPPTLPDGKAPHPPGPPPVHPNSAFAYFLTATAISVITLAAFTYLLARNRQPQKLQNSTSPDDESDECRAIPMRIIFRKTFWLACAVFVTFGVTMVFPVFTQRIVSVRPIHDQPRILHPPSFIPLAFLFWNTGDLIGRLITAVPSLTLTHRPRLVFVLAVLRVGFVGLYHLCNVRGKGAIVPSDFFYLVVVQLFFGLTNGYLGSTCMIGAGEWVEPEEREATGGFMGLCLVGGLTAGSLASFFVAGV